jgi:glycosyltransferase involved in cell wall biosynthesis
MVENINRGIDIAAAPRAVILCADDYWQSSFLERVLAMNYGRAELLFTNCTVLQGGNEILNLNVHHGYDVIPPWRLIRHLHGIPLSSLMFPISGHKQRFDTRLPFNCDLEFVLRCMLKERFALRFLDWPGVFVGLHDANETSHYDIRRENIKLLDIVSEYDVGHSVRLAILAKKWRLLLG